MLHMTDEGQSATDLSLKENSLQMYSTLINMGFADDMSIRAANKYPNNADQAINWIVTQSSNKTSSAPSKQTTESKPSSQSIQPIHSSPQYKAQQQQSVYVQDLQSWVNQNNLGIEMLTVLQENQVTSLNDLRLLRSEQDINEFATDLGLKIMKRKKFIVAVKSLHNQQSGQTSSNNNNYSNQQMPTSTMNQPIQPYNNNYYNQYNDNNNYNQYPFANSQNQQHIYQYKQQQASNSNHNPYDSSKKSQKKTIAVAPSLLTDEKKQDFQNVDDIKKQKRKKRTVHLKGDVVVNYSLKKRDLDPTKKNRCILVIGATGTGKTTCLNSMMNYLWEVEFDDKFRYKLIIEDSKANQAKSQTKEVTAYYLNPPALNFSLTLVDTPGYGDTVGLTQDDQITRKIKHFFDKKIQSIDAVCFVIRAPQARLEATQRYVFSKVLEVFGKDIKDNIFILLTFADGQRPPALAAIKEAQIPYKKAFKLNNSGFFLHKDGSGNGDFDDDGLDDDDFGTNYWNMGMKAFAKFFSELNKVQPKSLTLTRKVLSRREKLQNYIVAIQPIINRAYEILEEMRIQIYEINRNATIIDKSKDYKYYISVNKTKQVPLTDGRNTTTCTNCVGHYTCHNDCIYDDNADKKGCCAMDSDGDCTVCPGNCWWNAHKNLPYIVEFYSVKEQRTTKELRDRYVDAKSAVSASDQIIAGLTGDLVKQENKLAELIDNVRKCINELRKIALQPNIMNKDDYIDQLIDAEKAKRNKGWQSRVKSLEDLKKRDNILFAINDNKFDNQFENYDDVNKYLNKQNHRENYQQQPHYQQQSKQSRYQQQTNSSKRNRKKKKSGGITNWFEKLF